jgi:hypothetical protein
MSIFFSCDVARCGSRAAVALLHSSAVQVVLTPGGWSIAQTSIFFEFKPSSI